MEGYLPTQLSFRAQRETPSATNFQIEGLLEGMSPQESSTSFRLTTFHLLSFRAQREIPINLIPCKKSLYLNNKI
jgi:hypothetical protein